MTYIVTGATRGIGAYLFDHYADGGRPVFGCYSRTPPRADKADLLTKVDITNYAEVSRWIEGLAGRLDRLVLINCAGVNYNSFAHKADIEKWKRVIDVNVCGSFNVIRCLLPIMRTQGFGRIINFSSVTAQLPTPGISSYAASKAALWGLTKSLAAEGAEKGITVNCLNLGYMNSGMTMSEIPEDLREAIRMKIPSKEFGSLSTIVDAVEFLENNSYVNGASIDISGGLL